MSGIFSSNWSVFVRDCGSIDEIKLHRCLIKLVDGHVGIYYTILSISVYV